MKVDVREHAVCPVCRTVLVWAGWDTDCRVCGAHYAGAADFPTLVPPGLDDQKRRQAEWFDADIAPEYEIVRPRGTPAFHRWLLAEKFRRSVAGLPEGVAGKLTLVVCAGSGMDAEFLAAAGADVVAADISSGAARRAVERSRRYGVPMVVLVADVERLPFPDRAFDLVYVHDGLHHIEHPLDGLREMARVARRAVSLTEPAQAAITRLSIRVGVSGEVEEAGNRVERLTLDQVSRVLEDQGFRIVRRERYGMFYRHEPGWAMRLLTPRPLDLAARAALLAANGILGRFGNKLTVQAIREDA